MTWILGHNIERFSLVAITVSSQYYQPLRFIIYISSIYNMLNDLFILYEDKSKLRADIFDQNIYLNAVEDK